MKLPHCLFAVLLLAGLQPATAQTSREQAEARTLYQQANTRPSSNALRANLTQQASGFLGNGTFQPGALRTFDGRYRPVPGLRFHTSLHLIEVQDSIELDSTHIWPIGSLRGFDLGDPEGRGADAPRRFRSRLVKDGASGAHREFVEVLTTVDAGPLLLAWLYSSGADVAANRLSLAPLLVVGSGTDPNEALRPIALSQNEVLRLFGKREKDVSTFANAQHLQYDRPTDVAKMIDHYNRVAVVK